MTTMSNSAKIYLTGGCFYLKNILEVDSMCPAPTWIFSSWIVSTTGGSTRYVGYYKGMLGSISHFLHLVGGSTQLKLSQHGFIFPILWGENKKYIKICATNHLSKVSELHQYIVTCVQC